MQFCSVWIRVTNYLTSKEVAAFAVKCELTFVCRLMEHEVLILCFYTKMTHEAVACLLFSCLEIELNMLKHSN